MTWAVPSSVRSGQSFYMKKKWSVAPAWTCYFHQDESLDDTGQNLI